VELLTTMVIIAVLATLSVATVRYAQSKARVAKVQHDTDQINKAIGMLANDCGVWPGGQPVERIATSTDNEICPDGCDFDLADPRAGLAATDGSYENWDGPYMHNIPEDPWGMGYFFDTDYQVNMDNEPCDGAGTCRPAAVIGSYGPDGSGNEEYNSDDIIKVLIIE